MPICWRCGGLRSEGEHRHPGRLLEAARALRRAADVLQETADRGTYRIGEMQEIRRSVLRTVRSDIDPYAHPVMPDERRY